MLDIGDRREVFVRSMAHRGATGGLADAVPVCVRLLGAVGVEVVILETVGVGQIELEIVHAADTVIAVVSTGWGDAIQASKAGLLEVADVFVVNKADRPGAARRGPRPRADARRGQRPGTTLGRRGGRRCAPRSPPRGPGSPNCGPRPSAHRDWLMATGALARRRDHRLRHEIGRRAKDLLARHIDARTAALDLTSARRTPAEWAVLVAADACAAADPRQADTA